MTSTLDLMSRNYSGTDRSEIIILCITTKNGLLLASKQHSGTWTTTRSKLLAKLDCAVTANKGLHSRKDLHSLQVHTH